MGSALEAEVTLRQPDGDLQVETSEAGELLWAAGGVLGASMSSFFAFSPCGASQGESLESDATEAKPVAEGVSLFFFCSVGFKVGHFFQGT